MSITDQLVEHNARYAAAFEVQTGRLQEVT